MTAAKPEDHDPAPDPMEDPGPCRRLERDVVIREVRRCPYFYGRLDLAGLAGHQETCEYDPDADCIHFGFPEDFGRYHQA